MLEAESAFIESLQELMKVMENLTKDVTSKIVGKHTDNVRTLRSAAGNVDSLLSVLEKPFQVMTHEESIDILDGNSGNFVHNENTVGAHTAGLRQEHLWEKALFPHDLSVLQFFYSTVPGGFLVLAWVLPDHQKTVVWNCLYYSFFDDVPILLSVITFSDYGTANLHFEISIPHFETARQP